LPYELRVVPVGCDECSYQPQDVGFEESFMPTPYVYRDNRMYINRKPVQTKGWQQARVCIERDIMIIVVVFGMPLSVQSASSVVR
jgi:hypothetical protein